MTFNFILHLKTRNCAQKLRNILHQKPERQNGRHCISPLFLYWRKGKLKFWFFFLILCIILSTETDYTLLLKENWILLQIHRIHINSIILPFTCMFIRTIRPMKIKLSLQIYHDTCFIKLEKYSVSCLGVIISFKHTFLLHIILLMSEKYSILGLNQPKEFICHSLLYLCFKEQHSSTRELQNIVKGKPLVLLIETVDPTMKRGIIQSQLMPLSTEIIFHFL